MTLQTFQVHATPLSPVHVGCGESFEPTNYVVEDGWLHAFDTGAAINALTQADRKLLLDLGNRRPDVTMLKDVQRFFHERRDRLAPFATRLVPLLDSIAALHAERVGKDAQRENDGRRIINQLAIDRTSFDRVNDAPVLFGSSIKGAIRTALLDDANQGRRAPEPKGLHEFQGRLFEYLNDRGRPEIELDPLRLLHVSDLRCEAGEPQSQVWYAVNRKKAEVRDERGNLRKSQAETQDLSQMLECVLPWQHRGFIGELAIRSVDAVPDQRGQGRRLLPAAGLRPAIDRLAHACNRFYRRRLNAELEVLERRGYVDERWVRSVRDLLAAAQPELDQGRMLLLRVGRHSGAESVTLEGVRKIRILEGKDPVTHKQRSVDASEAKTVWLAARDQDDRQGLLPFGWLLIEIAPLGAPAPTFDPLAAACNDANATTRARADALRERRAELDRRRRAIEDARHEEIERAAQEAEAKARAERAAAEEEQRKRDLPPHQRLVEDFVDAMRRRAEQLGGRKDRPNTDFHQRAGRLAKQALEGSDWSADDKRAAAAAIEEWLPKVVQLPDVKAAFKKLELRRLRGEG